MATSKVLKPRRGSTAEHATFKGQAYEITFDTDKKTIVAHDGLTMGGFPLAHEAAVSETDTALRALIDQKVSEVQGVSSSELNALESALRGLINNNAQQQVVRDTNQDNVVSALDSTLRALIAEELTKKLSISGGTMTGRLIIQGDYRPLTIQGTADNTDIALLDKDERPIGYIRASGTTDAPIVSFNAIRNGSSWKSVLEVGADTDGTAFVRHNGSPVLSSAGGTLTGDLEAQDCGFPVSLSAFDVASAPASAKFFSPYLVTDKNGKLLFLLQAVQWSGSVNNVLRFILGKKDGSEGAILTMTQPESGDASLDFEGSRVTCAAKDVVVKSNNGKSIVCPSGGTWTYFVCVHINNQQSRATFMSGTCAGGATLTHGEAAATNYYNGIFIRTA